MLLPCETDLTRRDSALPGLATVLDAAAFANTISSLTKRPEAMSAHIRYVRYKPGRRCLVRYEVIVGGDTFDIVGTALNSDGWRKHLATADPAGNAIGLPIGDPKSQIALSVFPTDRRLRCLEQLLDAEKRVPLLRKLFPETPEWWSAELALVAWRPSRRFVLRGDVDGQPVFALKGYCQSTFKRALAAAEDSQRLTDIRLPQFVGTNQRHRILAFGWLPGELLADAISSGRYVDSELQAVGVELSKLHQDESFSRPKISAQVNTAALLESESAGLRKLAADIGVLLPAMSERVEQLAMQLIDRLRSHDSKPATIHGDFYAKQVLLNDGSVSIIDFDESRQGDTLTDVGNFIAKLVWMGIQNSFSGEYVAAGRSHFLKGYQQNSDTDESTLRTHTAIGLLKSVPHPFRRGWPEWPSMMKQLVDSVEFEITSAPPSCRATSSAHSCVSPPNVGTANKIGDCDILFLKQALNPTIMASELQRAAPEFLPENLRITAMRVVKHKPGRRCLVAYEVSSPTHSQVVTVLGKIRAKGLDRRSFETQSDLYNGPFSPQSADGICVPRPLGVIPAFNMWLQEMVPGQTLTATLTSKPEVCSAARVVQAVRKLQVVTVETDRVHTLEKELDILLTGLRQLADVRPELANRVGFVISECERHVKTVSGESNVACHRDFFPDQVMVDGKRLWLLDFDLFCRGPESLDVGNFRGHLLELSIRDSENCGAIQRFLTEFDDACLAANFTRRGLDAFSVFSLARLVYLSLRYPDRASFLPAILHAVEVAITGLQSRH